MYVNRKPSSESLHYSTVTFPSKAGSEIRGRSSLTAEYATVHHGSEQQNKGGIIESEANKNDTEQIKDSDGDEALYAQVKPHKDEQKE